MLNKDSKNKIHMPSCIISSTCKILQTDLHLVKFTINNIVEYLLNARGPSTDPGEISRCLVCQYSSCFTRVGWKWRRVWEYGMWAWLP